MHPHSTTQMTLDDLIKRLESFPPDAEIEGLHYPHSYRGYYSDLAFERGEKTTAARALELAEGCFEAVFEGYKGGYFEMTGTTPVWSAYYGLCGMKLIDIKDDGTLQLVADD